MSLETWVVIMLAGVTLLVTLLGLMLAALTVAIGIAAVFGYAGMLEAVSKKAESAAREVSLIEVTKKATEAAGVVAKQIAIRTIMENKDKWLVAMQLGVELAEAQSEGKIQASDTQAVGSTYPGEGDSNDDGNTGTN